MLKIEVQKPAGSNWGGIKLKMDKMEIMGWPSDSPVTNVTVQPETGDLQVVPSDKYYYITESKKLTVLYELDMDTGYTIHFHN